MSDYWKRQLLTKVTRALDAYTQVDAARLLGVTQPRISELRNGKAQVSLERLMQWLNRLGYDVEIRVKGRR